VEDVLAIVMVFGTGMVAIVAFSPIGRAIANAINRKSGAGVAPELQESIGELADRVESLQQQVGELAERQDFAERLLAKVREKGLPAGGGAA
jgi:hypothetical protein